MPVVLRLVAVERLAVLRRVAVERLAVLRRLVVLRRVAVERLAVLRRLVVFRAVVLRPVVFRAVVLRPVVFRAVVLRRVPVDLLFEAVFLLAEPPRADVVLREELFRRPPLVRSRSSISVSNIDVLLLGDFFHQLAGLLILTFDRDVGLSQNSNETAVFLHDGKSTHLVLRHQTQRFVEILLRVDRHEIT